MAGALGRSWRPTLRRLAFAGLTLATITAIATLLLDMLRANGMEPIEYPIFALATLLLAPIVVSFWLAVFGFVSERRGDPLALRVDPTAPTADLSGRTAIVVPIYNEAIGRVLACLRAAYESLESTGRLAAFDFFVLSDSTDPQRWLDEEIAVTSLRTELGLTEGLYYRNRAENVEKKAGNIADFCRQWGSRYLYMIVFDADSVMSGATLVRLVQLMDADPQIGIIQAPPVPVNGTTLFSRLQQFASRAYGPTWAVGLAWLQGSEGNYYGHNAIIRVQPFVEHCKLPTLPGKAPLGGMILSHDFVEAALMRRAGFSVYLAPSLDGSYEETPPTLIDHTARERRWCQGNLQHARLLAMPGLHPMSRFHLAMGVMAYVSAPLWLLLLVCWTGAELYWSLVPHQYFEAGSLFPVWQVSIAARATLLFVTAMLLLIVPRALAVLSRLLDRRERRAFGGGWSLLGGFVCEVLLSMLLAPVMMIEASRFVVGILLGRSVGWNAQMRDAYGVTLAVALRRHALVELAGIGWSIMLLVFAPASFWWLLPVLAGLVLAVPLSMLTSRSGAGRWAFAHGLLTTPEELAPTPVLVRLRELLAHGAATPPRGPGNALERLLADSELLQLHLSLNGDPESDDPLRQHEVRGLELKSRLHGPAALTAAEQRLLLRAPSVLLAMAERSKDRGSAVSDPTA